MPVFIALLSALGEFFAGLGQFIAALTGAYLILGTSPAQTPELSAYSQSLSDEAEVLYSEFQRQMDLQYEAGALARYVQTLPALPEEGY
ncbi:hypothetical protein [Bradyrhizobium sp.]|jgi:hypothetical protein|uniref:hypothetical protein n=1 Tax=Bradyrhizobium sp. TaxID=376 RepID=UPI003C1AF685